MGTIWEAICYVGGATEPVRYFYRTNAQGDVKQIVDKDNNVIAYYDYDAWGGQLAVYDGNDKPVSGDSHFANVNPFRSWARSRTQPRRDSITCKADTMTRR